MPDSKDDPTAPISARKADHIDLCIDGDVAFRGKTNLFDDIDLVHTPLPELALSEIDLSTVYAGKRLAAPLVIAAMTGGVDRADRINRDLASVAEELGIGFAFGSQRPMLTKGITAGYQVRDEAPTALVMGNIGVVQAAASPTRDIAEMVAACGADALAIHLNPAMEVVQPEGDDDFRGGLDTIRRLVDELPVPVIVKETGCGLSRATVATLIELGVNWVDTSGAGGTSWVAVERQRAAAQQRRVGDTFWDWGIPTAACVAQLADEHVGVCATGGVATGLDIAKALAMGAVCGGIARHFLQAHAEGGRDGALAFGKTVIQEIRVACLLTGCGSVRELRLRPLVIGGRLDRWVPRQSSLRDRYLSAR